MYCRQMDKSQAAEAMPTAWASGHLAGLRESLCSSLLRGADGRAGGRIGSAPRFFERIKTSAARFSTLALGPW